MKKALVFGANSQMGSYMCELLLSRGYAVAGTVREAHEKVQHLLGRPNFQLWFSTDITKSFIAKHLLMGGSDSFDEAYNFAGRMSVEASWEESQSYLLTNGVAVQYMLEALRKYSPQTKFFNGNSAGVFAKTNHPCDEESLRRPDSPDACAKHLAELLVSAYRKKYGLFACTGIFYNIESPRRDKRFFAEKVISEVVRMKLEVEEFGTIQRPLELGKLSAVRDWGLAQEYVRAAWEMLQRNTPEDYVIGTGQSYSCFEFVDWALEFSGLYAIGFERDFDYYVKYDKEPGPEDVMRCNPSKIQRERNWQASLSMTGVVSLLYNAEMQLQRAKILDGKDNLVRQSKLGTL